MMTESEIMGASLHTQSGDLFDSAVDKDHLLATVPNSWTDQTCNGAGQRQECVICCDKTEDFVLECCQHALCADCEKQWVRKRLRCPFCRQSFSTLREATRTQWQLNVSAIPTEQIQTDVQCLERRIHEFWSTLMPLTKDGGAKFDLESFLAENYVRRRQRTIQTSHGGNGFVVVGV
jgi:hypothetical protein